MDARELASRIDQTLLKPTIGQRAAREWMLKQRDAGFASLCVSPFLVPTAAEVLGGTPTKVCTVVAFPLGYEVSSSKADEARRLVELGAAEIDMVMNIAAALEDSWEYVITDIGHVVRATREASGGEAIVKVIIECAYLGGPERITEACRSAVAAGADFVKTSTGFGPSGATVDDVRTMHAAVRPGIGVKAAGGIRSLADMLGMLDAGATRIGTSSGLEILAESERSQQGG